MTDRQATATEVRIARTEEQRQLSQLANKAANWHIVKTIEDLTMDVIQMESAIAQLKDSVNLLCRVAEIPPKY